MYVNDQSGGHSPVYGTHLLVKLMLDDLEGSGENLTLCRNQAEQDVPRRFFYCSLLRLALLAHWFCVCDRVSLGLSVNLNPFVSTFKYMPL